MQTSYSDLVRIANSTTARDSRTSAMRSFARDLNWYPSYEIQGDFGVKSAVGHIVVEHGLENAAAISFIQSPNRASDIVGDQLKALLSISYNNLIEWHLFVSEFDARWINNLADRISTPSADSIVSIHNGNIQEIASSAKLDELHSLSLNKKYSKSCDDALLQVVSRWKSLLKADYPAIDNKNISALFNALMFVRGCEDQQSFNTDTRFCYDRFADVLYAWNRRRGHW